MEPQEKHITRNQIKERDMRDTDRTKERETVLEKYILTALQNDLAAACSVV